MVDQTAEAPELQPGRKPPLDPAAAEELFRRGVSLFNGVRYWHAHEAWEELWRAAPDEERDFYQGLIQVAEDALQRVVELVRDPGHELAEGGDRPACGAGSVVPVGGLRSWRPGGPAGIIITPDKGD